MDGGSIYSDEIQVGTSPNNLGDDPNKENPDTGAFVPVAVFLPALLLAIATIVYTKKNSYL